MKQIMLFNKFSLKKFICTFKINSLEFTSYPLFFLSFNDCFEMEYSSNNTKAAFYLFRWFLMKSFVKLWKLKFENFTTLNKE